MMDVATEHPSNRNGNLFPSCVFCWLGFGLISRVRVQRPQHGNQSRKYGHQCGAKLNLPALRHRHNLLPEARGLKARNNHSKDRKRTLEHEHVHLVLADLLDREGVIEVRFLAEHGKLSGDGARVREGVGAATRRATTPRAAGR